MTAPAVSEKKTMVFLLDKEKVLVQKARKLSPSNKKRNYLGKPKFLASKIKVKVNQLEIMLQRNFQFSMLYVAILLKL